MSINDQHVVVVGGTSGIGLRVARDCLEQGCRVTVASRSLDRLSTDCVELAPLTRPGMR